MLTNARHTRRTGKLGEGSAKTKYTCEGQDPEGTGETNQSNHKGGKNRVPGSVKQNVTPSK